MPPTISSAQRRARLARRHRLLPQCRTDDVPTIADDLVALHSSDPVTVYLSAMVRMAHPSVAAVERALYEERSVVRHHAMRRTLWVATPEVVRLMHVAATRKLAAPEHRRTAGLLADNGVEDPDAWLAEARDQVRAALAEHGPMTARELGQAVPALTQKIVLAPGKRWSATVSAHTRVLLSLGFEGEVVRTRPTGTWINGAYTYAAMDDWLPGGLSDGAVPFDEREAARQLALRWLRAFGPGTTADLQWWAGWTATLTRRALADAGAVEVSLESGPGWLAPDDAPDDDPDDDPDQPDAAAAVDGWVALLPGLDPTTMGWKERDWYLPARARDAFDRNGNGGPTIWVDGRVVGVWAPGPDGALRTHFFEEPTAAQAAAVAARVADLEEMLDGTRFTVRFPSPVSTVLAAGGRPG